MKRGWILTISILSEISVIVTVYLFLKFLPIPTVWEIVIEIGGIITMLLLGFGLIYFWWAPNNLFFTFIREGTAKVVVRAHRFCKALIQFKGYVIDNPKKTVNVVPANTWVKDGKILNVVMVRDEQRKWVRIREEVSVERKGKKTKEPRENSIIAEKHKEKDKWYGGLRFYGFWPISDIFTYEFEWVGVKENGEFDPHPKETLDCIILKDDVYGCRVEKAEDKELMPLDIKLTLTVRIINPYKALFVVENWYETMMNRVRPYVRDFITTNTYAEFIKNPQRIGKGVTERLEREGILNELVNRYGVDIRKIEVNTIDPVEEFRKVVMAKVLALREKDRIITEAEAERDRLEKVAQGEEKRINTVYGTVRKYGSLGETIRTLEALEKSPEKGAKWIIPLPGMVDLFSRVFPSEKSTSS